MQGRYSKNFKIENQENLWKNFKSSAIHTAIHAIQFCFGLVHFNNLDFFGKIVTSLVDIFTMEKNPIQNYFLA